MKPKTAVYMRVSTDQQKTDSQKTVIKDYLQQQGIPADQVKTYQDKISGKTVERADLQKLLRDIDKGKIHTLIVTRLDRLSRSVKDGLTILQKLTDKGIRVVAIQQNIDFNGSMGKFLSTLFLALAEFERDTITSRIREGLQARREKGLRLGRPRNIEKLAEIKKLHDDGMGVTEISRKLGCSRANCYSLLSRANEGITQKKAV